MSESVILALIALAASIIAPIVAALVALIRGNQDAAEGRREAAAVQVAAKAERDEQGRDIKEIHKQTNSAYEAVTTKADERERVNNEKNDKRFAALEELFKSAMEQRAAAPAEPPPAAPVSVNPITGDPSTPVHVTNVPTDPLHVVDAAPKEGDKP